MHDTYPSAQVAEQLHAIRETITADPATLTQAIARRAALESRDQNLGEGWMVVDNPTETAPFLGQEDEVAPALAGMITSRITDAKSYHGPRNNFALAATLKAMTAAGELPTIHDLKRGGTTHVTAINILNAAGERAIARTIFDRAGEYATNAAYVACINQRGYLVLAPNAPGVTDALQRAGFRPADDQGQQWFAGVMPAANQRPIVVDGKRPFGYSDPEAVAKLLRFGHVATDPVWRAVTEYWKNYTPPVDMSTAMGSTALGATRIDLSGDQPTAIVDVAPTEVLAPIGSLAETLTTIRNLLDMLRVENPELRAAVKAHMDWAYGGGKGRMPQPFGAAQIQAIHGVLSMATMQIDSAPAALLKDPRLNSNQ